MSSPLDRLSIIKTMVHANMIAETNTRLIPIIHNFEQNRLAKVIIGLGLH